MPEYLSPAVYIEELPSGIVPIQGVGTSTAGFVGQTERGPSAATLVTSWQSYQRWYGGYADPSVSYLPYAVAGFFSNGGQRLFVARVTAADAVAATLPLGTLEVRAVGRGDWGGRLFVRIENSRKHGAQDPDRFRLTLLYYQTAPPTPLVDPTDTANLSDENRREPEVVEDYDDLGFNPLGPRYVLNTVNPMSRLAVLSWAQGSQPARPTDAAFAPLAGGSDGTVPLTAGHYTGQARPTGAAVDERFGLSALEAIDAVAILAIPDIVNGAALQGTDGDTVKNALLDQCERLRERFAVLDVPAGQADVSLIAPQQVTRRSDFAAIYYPWVRVADPRTGGTELVPPSGFVAGVYAYSDVTRGVHKAPANYELRGIVTRNVSPTEGPVEFPIAKGEHDVLNPAGINVIRDFRSINRGVRVWGARTISADPDWVYVNVRRLFLYVEESVEEAMQWVVFEPNDEPTWAKVRRSIVAFLERVWRDGALMGATAEEAYFVRCDRTTMSPDDILNGRLICLVGLAPVRPAEFVIIRFSQKTIEAAA